MDKDLIEKKLDELTDVVVFIKKKMVTKDELRAVEERLGTVEERLEKTLTKDEFYNRMDFAK